MWPPPTVDDWPERLGPREPGAALVWDTRPSQLSPGDPRRPQVTSGDPGRPQATLVDPR